jgi:hypothetical protein
MPKMQEQFSAALRATFSRREKESGDVARTGPEPADLQK